MLKKKGDFLFDKVKGLEISILDHNVRPDIVAAAMPCLVHNAGASSSAERKATSERFMDSLRTAFEHHSLCMTMITDVLMYMVGTPSEATMMQASLMVFRIESRHQKASIRPSMP